MVMFDGNQTEFRSHKLEWPPSLEYLPEVELVAVPPAGVGAHALALGAVRAELAHAAAARRPERVHQRALLRRRPVQQLQDLLALLLVLLLLRRLTMAEGGETIQ